jgi:hypothetical protein
MIHEVNQKLVKVKEEKVEAENNLLKITWKKRRKTLKKRKS